MKPIIEKKGYAPLIVTDGGRFEAGYTFETNDCTVRALSLATGKGYEWAWKELKKAGRRTGKGFTFLFYAQKNPLLESVPIRMERKVSNHPWYGEATTKITVPRTTLGRFITEHPKGRFLVIVERHIFAVIDGICYDGSLFGKRKYVHSAWKVNENTVS